MGKVQKKNYGSFGYCPILYPEEAQIEIKNQKIKKCYDCKNPYLWPECRIIKTLKEQGFEFLKVERRGGCKNWEEIPRNSPNIDSNSQKIAPVIISYKGLKNREVLDFVHEYYGSGYFPYFKVDLN